MIDDEEDFDEFEPNVLLQYCFPDVYGPNYGFRTLLSYEDECEVGESCDSDGETLDICNGDLRGEDKIGTFLFTHKSEIMNSNIINLYWGFI